MQKIEPQLINRQVKKRFKYFKKDEKLFLESLQLKRNFRATLVSREADECLSVGGEQSGAGDETDVAAVFIHHGEVPCFGILKLLGCLLERVGHIEHSGRGFHE